MLPPNSTLRPDDNIRSQPDTFLAVRKRLSRNFPPSAPLPLASLRSHPCDEHADEPDDRPVRCFRKWKTNRHSNRQTTSADPVRLRTKAVFRKRAAIPLPVTWSETSDRCARNAPPARWKYDIRRDVRATDLFRFLPA